MIRLNPDLYAAHLKCKDCGHVQEVKPAVVTREGKRVSAYFGSAYDFCNACDGHPVPITRITLTAEEEGDMFDGTIEQWKDAYFSNFSIEGAKAFAESEGVTIKFY